jgi:hypothetical protein
MQRFLLILLATGCAANPSTRTASLPGSTIRGTIVDSASGQPLPGLYIWPFRSASGTVTDSNGQFVYTRQFGINTYIIRACTDSNLATIWVDFLKAPFTEAKRAIRNPFPCPPGTRAPWAVDSSDTTTFKGIYTYSWEGGGWFAECSGKTHQMDHASPTWSALDPYTSKEGQQAYVEARGRVVEDHLGNSFPGPVLLVGPIMVVRPPRPSDCK